MKTVLQLFLNLGSIKSGMGLIRKSISFGLTLLIALFALFGVQGAFAQTLSIGNGQTVTITVDTYYDYISVQGTLIVNSPAILTVGASGTPAGTESVEFRNGSIVNIKAGASLVVNGLLNNRNNSNGVTINGAVQVNGNVTAGNGSTIVGTGSLNSTGTITTGNPTGAIFGNTGECTTGPCNGNNLCSYTNTLTSYSQNICSGNATVAIAGSAVATPVSYQWQSSSTSGSGFANISGATTRDLPARAITNTTYFRRVVTKGGCTGNTSQHTATVAICPNIWTGTTSTAWNVATNWSLGSVPTSTSTIVIPATVTSTRMPEISATFNIGSLENNGTITSSGSSTLNVYGNIVNNGSITAASGATSTINMVGSTAQTISGTSATNFKNLNINNTSGVTLLSALSLNGTLTLTSGALTTNNNLTLNFDNGANIAYNVSDAGSISGNVTAVRNLSARAHYISIPFNGITTGQLDASTPLYRSATGSWLISTKKYDTQGWTKITDYTTTLSPVSGYSLTMFNPATITMSGTYTHGASYSSGNYTNVIPSTILNGMYFMVGNPYPSTLDWNNASGWTKTNIDNAIYFWNPTTNSVASYISGTGTNGGTQYIPAMQAFLVKVPGGGGFSSVAVNNNARVVTSTSYFRTASNEIARLIVKNAAGTSMDETVVRIDDLATEDFDSDADASKLQGGLALYTKTTGSNEEYSINTLPINGPEMLVPLNLKVSVAGLYTIECSEYSVPGYSLILEDKQTGSYTLLDNSTIYTINANPTDNTDRFVLRFRTGLTTGVVSGSSSALQISTYDNQLMLNAGSVQTDKGTIRIYDASGLAVMELKDQSIVSGIQVIALPGLTQGVYIAKVEVEGTTYVGKVVVK